MAGGMDLVAKLAIDTSKFNESITAAAQTATSAGDLTIKVIHEQQASWSGLALVAIPAIGDITTASINLASAVETSFGQIKSATLNLVASSVNLVASSGYVASALLNMSDQIGTTAAMALSTLTVGMTTMAAVVIAQPASWAGWAAAIVRWGSMANTVAKYTIPQWKIVGTVIGGAVLAYKVATSEATPSVLGLFFNTEKLSQSFSGLINAGDKIGNLFTRPFEEGGAAVAGLIEQFMSMPSSMPDLTTLLTTPADYATKMLDNVSWAIQKVSDYGIAAKASLESLVPFLGGKSIGSMSSYVAEGEALRKMAEESEKLTSKLEAQRAAFKNLAEAQQNGAQAAARQEEIHYAQSLKTVQAIDAEITKIQQRAAAEITSGKGSSGSQAHNAKLLETLAGQRAGVESGRITEKTVKEKEEKEKKSPVDDAIDAAAKKFNELSLGESEAALATAEMNGATEDQIAELAELLQGIEEITAAKKAQKDAEQAAAQAAREAAAEEKRVLAEQERTYKSWEDKIEKSLDEVMLKTGEATKGQIAYDEALRGGATKDQAEEYAALVEELDALNEEEKAGKKKDKSSKDENKASLAGSSEAAKIALSGISPGKSKLEDLGKQQIVAIKGVNTTLNLIKNKPGAEVVDLQGA